MLASEPNGIIFAATFVASMDTTQEKAQRKIANRTSDRQCLFMISVIRSHGFHRSVPHLLLIAAVARIPMVAERVTATILANYDRKSAT